MINTAIETVVDLFVDVYHPKAKIAKDVAAGAVVLAACNALVVGYFIFFNKENIKVVFSGRKEPLKKDVIEAMEYLSESTKNNTKGILNICLNYGGRSEIVDAVNHIIKDNLNCDIIKL